MGMMGVRRFAVAGAVAASSLMGGFAAQAETLGDALVSAYRNSGILDQQRAVLRAADEDVAVAVAALRPVVSYALGHDYSSVTDAFSTTLTLTASMTLYDFGRSQLGVEAAKEAVMGTRQSLVNVEQQVLLRAVEAYMGVREQRALVNLRQNNVRLITQELRAANDRFEVGEVTRTDVSLAEARLAAARSALAAAEGTLAVQGEEYRAAIGHYPTQISTPPRPPATAKSLDAAKALARKNHPEIKSAQHTVTLSELSVTLAETSLKPSLDASLRTITDKDGTSKAAGVTLSGPIYAGGQIAANIRKAQAQRDGARAALLVTTLGVEQGVGNAWAGLTVASAGVEASARQVRASRVAFDGVQEEATLGARTTLDVLNAEQELLDAQAAAISAETDRYVAVYEVLSAMGLLTADHLGLGINTYDPAAYYKAVQSAPNTYVSPQGEKLDAVLKSLGKF